MASSLSLQSGGWLRTKYIGEALAAAGWSVSYVPPYGKAWVKSLDCLVSLPRYAQHPLNEEIDVVMANKPLPNTLALLVRGARRGIFTVLDLDDDDTAMAGPLFAPLVKWVSSFVVSRTDLITTHNELLADHLSHIYDLPRDRIYLLKQGVNARFLLANQNPGEPCPDPRVRQWKRDGKQILFFMAHLNAASELSVILDGFQHLMRRTDEYRLLVVGGGIRLEAYKKQAARRGLAGFAHFTGALDVDGVIAYLRAADLCVLFYPDTSYNRFRESMKLREYLALAKTVACNTAGNLAEFAPFCHALPNDPREFAAQLGARVGRDLVADGREVRGRSYVSKHYDWDVIGGQLATRLRAELEKKRIK